jgi:hypothetical protein
MDDDLAELCADFERLTGVPSFTLVGAPVMALRRVVGWMKRNRANGVDVAGLVRHAVAAELVRLATVLQ